MRTQIKFKVDCIPPTRTAQEKRLQVVKGKPMFFHDKKAKSNEELLAGLFEPFQPDEPIRGAVELQVIVTWPWRKGDLNTKAKRERAARLGYDYYEGKPDLDNFVKGVQDLLAAMLFIEGDQKVVALYALKYVGSQPGIEIKITRRCRDDEGEN